MKRKTTIKVSQEAHKNVLKTKKFLREVFKDFPLKIKIDNDFVVGFSTEQVLSHKDSVKKAVEEWKNKK
jgi:hypothetical protein